MEWYELYGKETPPTNEQIEDFIESPLWRELHNDLCEAYAVKPKVEYSNCLMDQGVWKGWNIKYKKSGKSLCTLYPRQGYFIAMIVVGAKEAVEADLMIPLCDSYTQNLYHQTKVHMGGKWLSMEVTSESILRDVLNLIALRVGIK